MNLDHGGATDTAVMEHEAINCVHAHDAGPRKLV